MVIYIELTPGMIETQETTRVLEVTPGSGVQKGREAGTGNIQSMSSQTSDVHLYPVHPLLVSK
jgi:hypothetical protein